MPKDEQKQALIELGRTYTYKGKQEDWTRDASKVSYEVLDITVKLMKMMESSLPFKKVYAETEKIDDVSVRSEVLRLILSYGKYGPEFTVDRMSKKKGGKLDRKNEIVQRAFQEMDENLCLREKE